MRPWDVGLDDVGLNDADFFHPLAFCRRQKVKGMVRNREKREDLARGVGGVEFVQFVRSFVRHKFTARNVIMATCNIFAKLFYAAYNVRYDYLCAALGSLPCTDAAPRSRAQCVVLSRNIARSRNGFVISTCSR